jgi:acyl dehydratase
MRPEVGRAFILQRTLTQADFDRFAALSGDDNPIHVDPDFAATTRFGKTVSHGMLLYSLIHRALQRDFPGAVALEQGLTFPSPTYAGEALTVRLTVTESDPANRTATVATVITKADETVVCEGCTRVAWGRGGGGQ